MFRMIAAATLVVIPVTLSAETDDERQARCEAQGKIVAELTELRLARTPEKRASAKVMENTPEAMQGSVAPLTAFIYSQPRKDLKDSNIAEVFVEQCAGYVAE